MKWIRGSDLESWALSSPAQSALPELVGDLIRGSVKNWDAYRFPQDDFATAPGYDGHLVCEGAPPYVPAGESVWEFGTGADFEAKADADIEKRTQNPRGIEIDKASFVFVTPRVWRNGKLSLQEWEAEKKKKLPWKDIHFLDGAKLEAWLEDTPPVAAKAARYLLRTAPAIGARSLDELWDEYSSRFDPSLTEDAIQAGRQENSRSLLEQVTGVVQNHLWLGDSYDEVLAFIAAAIRTAEPDLRRHIEAHTLVLDTEEAARFYSQRDGLIVLARAGAITSSGLLSRRNATFVPCGRENPRQAVAEKLKRPTNQELGEALKRMGLQPDKAFQVARTCGRSITVLSRAIARSTYVPPSWAYEPDLVPALLAGGWNAGSEKDREVLKMLASTRDYDEYEKAIRKFTVVEDAPIEREGSVWKIRAPVDALTLLGPLIGREHLARLHDAFGTIFSELDPSLELPPEERLYIASSQTTSHSPWLRDGLATTLLLLAAFADGAQIHVHGGAQAYVDTLVRDLAGLGSDWRLVASLRDQLTFLAEAAPRPLVEALEQLLGGDGSKTLPLFRDVDALFSSSPHTGLLWGIEVLAWDPELLLDAASLLARLAVFDPGGKLTNRPLNSLREIFLPWHPNTNATLDQQLAVLRHLAKAFPDVTWELCLKLLPEPYSVGHNNASPRYREWGASGKPVLTRRLVAESYEGIIEITLSLAGASPGRLAKLGEALPNLSQNQRAAVYSKFERCAQDTDLGGRTLLWSALRSITNRHRSFPTAPWSLKGAELDQMESLVHKLEPNDAMARAAWLFNDHHPTVVSEDANAYPDVLNRTREEAVKSLLDGQGMDAVIKLAELVKLPRFVAFAASGLLKSIAEFEHLLDLSLGGGHKLDEFAMVLSSEARRKFGKLWEEVISSRYKNHRASASQSADMLFGWEDEPATWAFAESLGLEVDRLYWKNKQHWKIFKNSAEAEFATEKYLAVERAITAIDVIHGNPSKVSGRLSLEALDKAINEINSSQRPIGHNFIYELGEVFKSLEARPDISPVELAKREYAYLPLFQGTERNLLLHRMMAEDPDLFVAVITDAFKPATGTTEELTEDRQRRARAGYQLLSSMDVVPGTSGNDVNQTELLAWAQKVQVLAAAADRTRIANEYIGQTIAHAPADPDGQWPHRAVRDVLEELKSDDVELGISVGRFNMRGPFSKAMYEGGRQERDLAAQNREWASASVRWPRTHALLLRMAEEWERHAEREDIRAKQDELKYEQ